MSEARPPLLLRIALYVLIAATAIVILSRRLNFDESLALRAGWLIIERLRAEPNFYMPFTLMLGALAHWISDPGTLFLLLRLFCLVTVLAALGWALFRTRLEPAAAALALLLVLLNWSFVVHGFEFRYDWAILVGLVVAFGALADDESDRYGLVGVVVAWLFAHHLKGVYFAALVYAAAWLRLALRRDFERRAVLRLHAAMVAVGVVWVAVSAASGHLAEMVGVYRDFFAIAAGSEKVWPWTALQPALRRDAVWWLVALASLAGAVLASARKGTPIRLDRILATLFVLAIVGSWFLHPHPWPYMIALPVPFLAVLLADGVSRLWRRFEGLGTRRWAVAGGLVVIAVLAQTSLGYPPGGAFPAGLAAPMDTQVATLRSLRGLAQPEDRVLDPSGLAYFLPPVIEQWYLDALFAERARRGLWMAGSELTDDPGQWALLTYRLEALPAALNLQVRQAFVPVGGGLALSRRDPRLRGDALAGVDLEHRRLESYW